MITFPQWRRWGRIGRAVRRVVGLDRWRAMITAAAEEIRGGDVVVVRLKKPVKVGDPVYVDDIVRPDVIGDVEDRHG